MPSQWLGSNEEGLGSPNFPSHLTRLSNYIIAMVTSHAKPWHGPSLVGIGKDDFYAVALRYLERWHPVHDGEFRRHGLDSCSREPVGPLLQATQAAGWRSASERVQNQSWRPTVCASSVALLMRRGAMQSPTRWSSTPDCRNGVASSSTAFLPA